MIKHTNEITPIKGHPIKNIDGSVLPPDPLSMLKMKIAINPITLKSKSLK